LSEIQKYRQVSHLTQQYSFNEFYAKLHLIFGQD